MSMKKNEKNEWIYIGDYISLSDTDFIHCDTRDFHILCIDNKKSLKETLKEIESFDSTGCEYTKEEILNILKSLELKSGGKKDWRLLSTKSHPTWLKYIRFVKVDNDKYIAYTTSGDRITKLLDRGVLTDDVKNINYIP